MPNVGFFAPLPFAIWDTVGAFWGVFDDALQSVTRNCLVRAADRNWECVHLRNSTTCGFGPSERRIAHLLYLLLAFADLRAGFHQDTPAVF